MTVPVNMHSSRRDLTTHADCLLAPLQKQEPLIHLLYCESRDILQTFLNRFIKHDIVASAKGSQICSIDVRDLKNCLDLHDIEIGAEALKTLKMLDSGRQKEVLMDVRSFYQEVAAYLAQKLPIKMPVVKNAQCLHPEVREQELAFKYMKKLSTLIPCLSDNEVPLVHDEWKIMMSENVPEEKIYNEEGELRRIDQYWNYIFSQKNMNGKLKYPNVKKLVASCLCLCHGNADVERSLSINNKLLTEERTKLSEESLNGLRLTRDAVSMYGGKELDVPITKDMQLYVKQAYSKYSARMEEERMETELTLKRKMDLKRKRESDEKLLKENVERKRKINEKEKEVKQDEAQLNDRFAKATDVFEEANKRLATAIKNKDFSVMNVAQGLLEVAKSDLDKVKVSMEKCREQRSEIDRKRRKLIDSYQSKQKSLVGKSDQNE